MKIQIQKRTHGFSLVELLLTMVLILCLAAASVFSYTALHRTANLEEGVDRLQSLIRFAQAEAATSGRKIQLQFAPEASEETADSGRRQIKVMWEADMLSAPGVFLEHTNKAWSESLVNELVAVEKVQPLSDSPLRAAAPTASQSENLSTREQDNPIAMQGELLSPAANEFPAITFYPDGTCDSAEIILTSRNAEDPRRLSVRLSGILGSVSSKAVSPYSDAEGLGDEFDDSFSEATFGSGGVSLN